MQLYSGNSCGESPKNAKFQIIAQKSEIEK